MVEELFFYKLFIPDTLFADMTIQTNLYHQQFIAANVGKIRKHSRVNKFPIMGVTTDRMKVFIALTYYMGIVRKQNLATYCSTDEVLNTPFCQNVMSRDEFQNIMSFFHLTDNIKYPAKGDADYNPQKKN